MSKTAFKCLIENKGYNDRLLFARFRSKFVNISVIVAYVPTNSATTEEKDTFYNTLDDILTKTPSHDLKIVIGDFNAQVGDDQKGIYQREMGRNGLKICTKSQVCPDNGNRLIEMWTKHSLVIGGTKFPHKDIHKFTWTAPDKNFRTQIYHVLVNTK